MAKKSVEKKIETPFSKDMLPEPKGLVVDELQQWVMRENPLGYAVLGWPREMFKILDYTGLRGSGSNVFWAFTHRVGKMRYTIRKVDEWAEINPNYTELYNAMLGQKQRIEGAIKSSLASVAQAVADYELLKHDSRRYKEILDYFKKGQTDQHVVRSLFVDRVDSYTGEGYSLITMAKRWPTIITDFIRMKEEWDDVSAIRKELDITQAEATILKTKNELFKEWKMLFLPTVKERYARIEALVKARRKSIDEYRNWLKPYIAKYKTMKEGTEHGDFSYFTSAFATPGFGTMDAWTSVRFWVWRPFQPLEAGKPEAVLQGGNKEGAGFIIDPYDNFVRHWKKKIELHYGIGEITDKEVRTLLSDAIKQDEQTHCSEMEAQSLYYVLFDVKILLNTLKSPPPEGVEMDNIMFIPIKIWVMSQNSLLIHLIEVHARKKWMERYMDELIGARSIEEDIYRKTEEEFTGKIKEEKKEERSFFSRLKPKYETKGSIESGDYEFGPNLAMRIVRLFIRPGPYEPMLHERLTKMYFRASGFYYKQMIDMLENAMGIE